MITLVPIAKVPNAAELLYELLRERSLEDDAFVNISHRRLPTWREHVNFIASRPYRKWFLIKVMPGEQVKDIYAPEIVGTCYLTRRNEIGIVLFKKHRGKGLGIEAVNELITKYQPLPLIPGKRSGRFLANINPQNARSIRLFQKLGFTHLSNTYQL